MNMELYIIGTVAALVIGVIVGISRAHLYSTTHDWSSRAFVSVGIVLVMIGGIFTCVSAIHVEAVLALVEGMLGNSVIGIGGGAIFFGVMRDSKDPDIQKFLTSLPDPETSLLEDMVAFIKALKAYITK